MPGTITLGTGPRAGQTISKDSGERQTTSPSETSAAGEPDHEKSVIEGIKGLIKQHSAGQSPGGQLNGKEVTNDSAIDQMSQAIKTVPGNSTDYG